MTVKNAMVYNNSQFVSQDFSFPKGVIISNFDNLVILPAFCDVHVHLREPGFSYKETILSGTRASARGGYSDVCSMPNLNPVPDNFNNLEKQLDIIKSDAVINVHPYVSITVGQKGEELTNFKELEKAFAFSDDGRGVQNGDLMREAMINAKALGKNYCCPLRR